MQPAFPTAWDGHARVTYLPDLRQLQITLVSFEPMDQASLRRGLRAAFVTDDPTGPPTFVSVELRLGRLPADLPDLLGPALYAATETVIDRPPRSRWVRLDVREVDELAAAWAPYRALVLSAAATPAVANSADDFLAQTAHAARTAGRAVGRWTNGLWTRLGVEELREGLAALPRGQLQFQGGQQAGPSDDPFANDDEDDEYDDDVGDLRPGLAGEESADRTSPVSGQWPLPAELANQAGVEPELTWELGNGGIDVIARRAGADAEPGVGAAEGGELAVSFDDGGDSWQELVAEPSGLLRARIASATNAERLPAIRVRVRDLA